MKFTAALLAASLISQTTALAIEHNASPATDHLTTRNPHTLSSIAEEASTLIKRKGGGGRGGGGGGGRSSSSSSGGGVSVSVPGRSPTSNVGGQSRSGSGAPRSFGGGGYYAGGAAIPYTAGQRRGNISPILLAPAALGGLFVGAALVGAWMYPYSYNYSYRNQSAINEQEQNVTLPVKCFCQENMVCGCDENDNDAYLNQLIGNGSYASLDRSVIQINNVNGTETLVLNGTLPMGTTAPGGMTDAGGRNMPLEMGGMAAIAAVMGYALMMA